MAKDHFIDPRSQGISPWWNLNVLFNDEPAVEQMVKKYAKPLSHPGLYPPVPAQWLHATVLAIGPVDKFSELEIEAVVGLLKPKLAKLELPTFVYSPWFILDDAVVLHILPDEHFSKIYQLVVEALEFVVGTDRTRKTPYGKYVSHSTLAYSRQNNQMHEIFKQLTNNPVQPASFVVNKLSLIKQYPKDGHYEWAIVQELPVGIINA